MHTIFFPGAEPFAISLCIAVGLALINLFLMAFHGDVSARVDAVHESKAVLSNSYWRGLVRRVLRLAGFGKVKVSVVVTNWFVFLGFTGYALQSLSQKVTDNMLPLALAVPLAVPIALLFTGAFSAMIINASQES
jgi:hypothetical protein